MPKEHDEEREHRIHYEIIVDAYDEYEQTMAWTSFALKASPQYFFS